MKGLKAGTRVLKVAGVIDRDRLFGEIKIVGEQACDGRGLPGKVRSWRQKAGDQEVAEGKPPVYGLLKETKCSGK